MSQIIYEGDSGEIMFGRIRLNGRDGAIQLFADEDMYDYDDDFITFQNADAMMEFVERLTEIWEDVK